MRRMAPCLWFLLSLAACMVPNPTQPVVSGAGQHMSTEWRRQHPVSADSFAVKFPVVRTGILHGKIRYILMERHSTPTVSVRVSFPCGVSAEPLNAAGIARVTGYMLRSGGNASRSASLSRELGMYGATLEASIGRDEAGIDVWVPTEGLLPTLELISGVLSRPSFDDELAQQVRAEVVAEADRHAQGTSSASSRARALLYGEQHAYGRLLSGNSDSVRKLTLVDVAGFYDRCFRPEHALVIIAGDIDQKQVEREVSRVFSDWDMGTSAPPDAEPPATAQRPPSSRGRPQVVVQDAPDAKAITISMAFGLPGERSTDWPAAIALVRIAAGLKSSRLNFELREKRSWTYGVSAAVTPHPDKGDVVFALEIASATNVGDALSVILELFGSLSSVGPTRAELRTAVKTLVFDTAWDLETNSGATKRVADLVSGGVHVDVLSSEVDALSHLRVADTTEVAERYFDPSRAVIVVRGPETAIMEQLKRANLVPVVK